MIFWINVSVESADMDIKMNRLPSLQSGAPFNQNEIAVFGIGLFGKFVLPYNNTRPDDRWWFYSILKESIVFMDIKESGGAGAFREQWDHRSGARMTLTGAKLVDGGHALSSGQYPMSGTLRDSGRFMGFPALHGAATWKAIPAPSRP